MQIGNMYQYWNQYPQSTISFLLSRRSEALAKPDARLASRLTEHAEYTLLHPEIQWRPSHREAEPAHTILVALMRKRRRAQNLHLAVVEHQSRREEAALLPQTQARRV
jgi:hypothetical protein